MRCDFIPCDLYVLEHFKWSVPGSPAAYINDRKAKIPTEAAVFAEEVVLDPEILLVTGIIRILVPKGDTDEYQSDLE